MVLKVALIGFGYAGQTFHAPLIAATPGLELTAIVSRQPEKVRAAWPQAAVLPDPVAAFAVDEIDLIVIATPNDTHADLARQALSAGKHIVIDKPFTVDLADANELVSLSTRADRLVSVFHNRRWDSDFLTLRRVMAAGDLGRITQFESHFDRFRPVLRDRWRERPGPGAGLWYDLGPHLIDQALCLFGAPQTLQADIATQRAGDGAPDYFHVVMRYADGLRVILHGSMLVAANGLRFAVHGDLGSFIAEGLDSQEEALKAGTRPGAPGWGMPTAPPKLHRIDGDAVWAATVATPVPGDYRRYYAAVHDAIIGNGSNPVTAAEALQVMQLLDIGRQSAASGRDITL